MLKEGFEIKWNATFESTELFSILFLFYIYCLFSFILILLIYRV